jgi:hypothetical protein
MRSLPRLARVTVPAAFLAAALLPAQAPRLDTLPIAVIDFHGLRTVSDTAARRTLGIAPGLRIPDSAGRAAAVARVSRLPGVRSVRFDPICCAESGGVLLYVGVEEVGAPIIRFAPAPTGAARLPVEVVAAGAAFDRAFAEAVAHGDFAETDTAGHAIMHWPAAGAAQHRFVALAARHARELRTVLRTSADPRQRALAAQVLGYATDKTAVVDDLAAALRDPDEGVRNDATRALALIALLAHRRPELGIQVPYDSLVGMLDSPVWTDRNKASLALAQITTDRPPALIAMLRTRSLPALLEMSRWQSMGHAGAALVVLGRVAGLPDQEIGEALQRGERAPILEAAERTARATR